MGRIIAEDRAQRMEVCMLCPFVNELKNKCKKCGCNLTLKTAYKNSRCPVGKWGPDGIKEQT